MNLYSCIKIRMDDIGCVNSVSPLLQRLCMLTNQTFHYTQHIVSYYENVKYERKFGKDIGTYHHQNISDDCA